MFLDEGDRAIGYKDVFFRRVALPMVQLYAEYKSYDKPKAFAAARMHLRRIAADDWSLAAKEWLDRRERRWETRHDKS